MSQPQEIEAIYKCKCMKEEVTVSVPFRQPGEDIGEWMRNVFTLAITLDHRRRSPRCRETTLEYAKLPVPENAPGIGEKPAVN